MYCNAAQPSHTVGTPQATSFFEPRVQIIGYRWIYCGTAVPAEEYWTRSTERCYAAIGNYAQQCRANSPRNGPRLPPASTTP